MQPYHSKLAELWVKYLKTGFFTKNEVSQFKESLNAHMHWVSKLNRLENLADAAAAAGDHEWENEIGREMDKLIYRH